LKKNSLIGKKVQALISNQIKSIYLLTAAKKKKKYTNAKGMEGQK